MVVGTIHRVSNATQSQKRWHAYWRQSGCRNRRAMKHTKKIQGISASYRPGSLTVGDHDMRTDIALDASAPAAKSPLPALLDKVIVTMLSQHDGDPTRVLAVTSEILRGTNWASYRNGRSRIATMAASYLRWVAPPTPWSFCRSEGLEDRRLGMRWSGSEGQLLDIIECQGRSDRSVAAGAANLDDIVGVRLLRLDAPRHSIFYGVGASPVRIAETPWLFEAVGS